VDNVDNKLINIKVTAEELKLLRIGMITWLSYNAWDDSWKKRDALIKKLEKVERELKDGLNV
jgi:hypothetical protein